MIYQTSYFKILNETETYIEFQSLKTHHCRIIQTQLFSDDPRNIYLYHKHSPKISYYHKQWSFTPSIRQLKVSIGMILI